MGLRRFIKQSISKHSFLLIVIFFFNSYIYCQGEWQVFTTNNSGIGWITADEVKADKHGNIWVTGAENLSKYDGEKWETWNLMDFIPGFPYIKDIDFDKNNYAWLATVEGVIRFDGKNDWRQFHEFNSGLDFTMIESIEIDDNNIVWCGGGGGKIAKYNGGWHTMNVSGTPTSVLCIENYDDRIYAAIGTNIFYSSDNGATWDTYNFLNSPMNEGLVTSIKMDSTGALWFIQGKDFDEDISGRLNVLEGTSWTTYDSSDCPPLYVSVTSLGIDSASVWFGKYTGVCWFDGTDHILYNTSNSVLPSNTVYDVDSDKNGNILIGTDEGLVIYNRNKIRIGYPQELTNMLYTNVFPNPASHIINLTWDNTIKEPNISIVSATGSTMFMQKYNANTAELDISFLSNGVYVILFDSDGSKTRKKFIVQHK